MTKQMRMQTQITNPTDIETTLTNNARTNMKNTNNKSNVAIGIARDRGPFGRPWIFTGAMVLLGAVALLAVGCGPTFDPPSLIEGTRVVGAHVEVAGAPDRATPMPGETATVTWLVTSPTAVPPLGWAFALCAPGAKGNLGCEEQPLSIFQGTDSPPRVTVTIPTADVLGTAQSAILYGRICANSAPTFDPQNGYPGCTDQGDGTTASVTLRLQTGTSDVNHNPTADRGFQLDGQAWPATAAGADPCVDGPRVTASTDDHVISIATAAGDRESYTAMIGDPPVPTAERESLQVSLFTTAGKMKSPYGFVEAADPDDQTTVEAKWKTPEPKKVSAPTPVTFTFVVRDGRGGTDWTTRTACVVPQ